MPSILRTFIIRRAPAAALATTVTNAPPVRGVGRWPFVLWVLLALLAAAAIAIDGRHARATRILQPTVQNANG